IGGELTAHLEEVYGPTEAPFLRAAFADPEDEAPRLVYADWLDDRQDTRGGVIRLAERLRESDTAGRERSMSPAQLTHGLGDWLWVRLMGYHMLVGQAFATLT